MKYDSWCDSNLSEEEWNEILEEHSDNYVQYYANEMQRIARLEEGEQKLQAEQLMRIMDEMQKLEELELDRNERMVKQELQKIGVLFRESQFSAEELREKWKNAFLENMTDEERQECFINEYLWHAFTYNKITNYLEGQEALESFDKQEKQRIYLFYQLSDEVYFLETHNKLNSKYLRFEKRARDMYIVDEEFTWTYIYKHCDNKPIWYEKQDSIRKREVTTNTGVNKLIVNKSS